MADQCAWPSAVLSARAGADEAVPRAVPAVLRLKVKSGQ